MASRENQTLQISLMAFAILVVLLAVTTYWFYSNWQKEYNRAETVQSEKDAARDNSRQIIEENRSLKEKLGFQAEDTAAMIDESYQTDMSQFAAEIEAAKQTYRNVLSDIFADKQSIALREADAKKQLKQLKDAMLALENQKNEQIKQHADEAETAKKDLAAERLTFNADREKFKQMEEQLIAERDKIREELSSTTSALQEKITKAETDLANLQRKTKLLTAEQEGQPTGIVEAPDARITWVDQRTRNVWIDVGESDAIRPQISFSVYGDGQVIDANVTPKAKIEVTRVVNNHLAEARIVEDDLTNPILPNDIVFSTAWEPGKRVHFAFTGILDLDGDGKSDLTKVRDIVRINGGAVDEFVSDSTGQRVKEGDGLTIETKFLVVGDTPEPVGDPDTAIHASTNAMRDEASTLGLRIINLSTFLDMMGWESGERTVQLGGGAQAKDFPPRLPGGVQKLDAGAAPLPGDSFRKRTPQPAY